jgi:hypothetical protein
MMDIEKALRGQYPTLFRRPILSKAAVGMLRFVLRERSINEFITKHQDKRGIPFIDAALDQLNISYRVDNRQIQNIPALGKVIIVSNHPLGALDAFALIKLVSSVRQDKKVSIIANQMLSQFTQIKEHLIPVDNMSGKLSKESLKMVDDALEREEAVIVFPAGEVARAYANGVRDGKWKSGFVIMRRFYPSTLMQKIRRSSMARRGSTDP